MINWLVKSSSEYPPIKQGSAPAGMLSRSEQSVFGGLRTDKRRHDWLLGRWTSKLLVQAVIREHSGATIPLDAVNITNDADGAPCVICDSPGAQHPITLSISHSGDRAFCAAVGIFSSSSIPVGCLGADIEMVQSRPPGFEQDYFTETEIALVSGLPAPTRDILVTATWSAKEASFKALRLGLTIDTRSATCFIEPVVDPACSWTPFEIRWDVRRLNRCAAAPLNLPELIGWWRIMDGYVLTLTANRSMLHSEFPILQEVSHD